MTKFCTCYGVLGRDNNNYYIAGPCLKDGRIPYWPVFKKEDGTIKKHSSPFGTFDSAQAFIEDVSKIYKEKYNENIEGWVNTLKGVKTFDTRQEAIDYLKEEFDCAME